VRTEAESAALALYLRSRPHRASSALARVEVIRAARQAGPPEIARAREVLANLHLIEVADALLADAAELEPPGLRALDAIHLAAARSLRGDLAVLITYDHRQAAAARALGMTVESPGTS
jgi:predicted nucleic acid-binding protein